MFNNAKWISKRYGVQDREYSKYAPILRKTFFVKGSIKFAELNICGLGQAEIYINNQKVTDDVLITPITKYDARVLYNTYDVTGLLGQSMNVIAVILGNGWYNYHADAIVFSTAGWRHHPKMIAELNIEYDNQKAVQINTDSSWKVIDSPLVFNATRAGEVYDARIEVPGFADALISDAEWDSAVIARSPGGVLEKNTYTPVRIVKTLSSVVLGGSVYDIGQNISGWARIFVKGERGDEIQLTYAEKLDQNGNIDSGNINGCNKSGMIHCDKYILKGDGEEVWEPRFVYHGFRYVCVTGHYESLKLEGRVVHNDFKRIGAFKCSSDLLNKIHSASVWSTLTNFCSIPTDCPHREQNGWTGDVNISCEQALMNFDISDGYKKWLLDFKDVQRPTGQLPGIIPTPGWSYNWGSGPAWDSTLILLPYHIYCYTGDRTAILQMWENMKRYMNFISSMADDYIVEFGLGDWCPPKQTNGCPVALTDTAYYYVCAKTMAECAVVLNDDQTEFLSLAKKIKEKFREKFVKDGVVNYNSQTAQACGIYQGLLNADEIPKAVKKLLELIEEKDGHTDCGILGMKYMFTALSANGCAEVIYDMIAKDNMPSYAYWINNGATTLCENWDMTYSRNHHMFSEVDMWFYRHLAGIQPGKPGFAKVVIKPSFIRQLDWVAASHNGISVEWKRQGEKIEIEVVLPEGTTGELHVDNDVFDLNCEKGNNRTMVVFYDHIYHKQVFRA